MYLDFGDSLYAFLKANSALSSAVKGNILPDDRNEKVPAIVYQTPNDSFDRTLEGICAAQTEVIISVVHTTNKLATQVANLVFDCLENATWDDGTYNVLGAFVRDTEQPETYTRGSQNDRLTVITLRFDLVVKPSQGV